MLNVNGVHATNGMAGIDPAVKPLAAARPSQMTPGPDVVEISMAAKLAAKVHDVPSVRTDLVARVRADIAAGVYETPERLEIAIDRLMEDLYGGLR